MAKKLQKSRKIVEGAMTAFTTAIVEIDKANSVLEASIAEDEKTFDSITHKINELERQLDEVSSQMVLKQSEIAKNNKLKDSLTNFIHGGSN